MELHVAADDRTGAFETAASLADHGTGPTPVVAWPGPDASHASDDSHVSDVTALVVDLGSRHLSPPEAAARAAELAPTCRAAHKMDSTLRGNWAEELVARAVRSPVLLVPALPEMGRVCVEGTVLDHGRPVHEGAAGTDVRRRVVSSRPADSLRAAAGAVPDPIAVTELADVDAAVEWLAEPTGVAVADAASDADIEQLVTAWWDRPDVVLAGTAAVIGEAGAHLVDAERVAGDEGADDKGDGEITTGAAGAAGGPVLVVCGSLHPIARAQLAEIERHHVPIATLVDDLTIETLVSARWLALVTEIPPGDVDGPVAVAATTSLARGVQEVMAAVPLSALVLIGGDTTAAVLGDADVVVHRSIAPGTPVADVAGFDVPVITRSGGFGSEHALVDLLEILRRGALDS